MCLCRGLVTDVADCLDMIALAHGVYVCVCSVLHNLLGSNPWVPLIPSGPATAVYC